MTPNQKRRMIWLLAIAWTGGWIHGIHFSPATLGVGAGVIPWLLLTVILYLYWRRSAGSTSSLVALLVYGVVTLTGAIVTVLPLSVLPFAPEQTVGHYVIHTVYAVCQLPLIFSVLRSLNARGFRMATTE